MAEAFEQEITTLYKAREQGHEAKRLQRSLSPRTFRKVANSQLFTLLLRFKRPAAFMRRR
jgi:hypothetical protein